MNPWSGSTTARSNAYSGSSPNPRGSTTPSTSAGSSSCSATPEPGPTGVGSCCWTTPATASPGTPPPSSPASTSAPAPRSRTASWRCPPAGRASACTTPCTPCPTGPPPPPPKGAKTPPSPPKDPAFRTKGQLAAELAQRARAAGVPFRALVADCFYGPSQSPHLADDLDAQGIGYVLALKPHTPLTEADDHCRTPEQAARQTPFTSPSRPGHWHRLKRRYRDGHTEHWWAAELTLGRYGPNRPRRLVVATSDPTTLPNPSTWYLVTNLPRRPRHGPHPPATRTEVVRLYGLRGWIEQDYKQVKHELGWADFQVRSEAAIQRHWTLVNLAFSFCWLQPDQPPIPPRTPHPSV